ncbi:type II toxin-antitoxin system Phd/YefM family antitoxin [Pseudoxanthomonas composti]|uniref:Type II toxin-antitoxin system Phd/YefM family antitoxin n=1 Tax=Pseudoxanthomonas composti TaxID=2137479 RepID=A0A4Q1JV41_9GAMM|nr:type II toxin-antitoxin system Phd/YefM family antitoxin [Pseudoxanthomonas composti]RXR06010.1 type II toxin-antitoxin system Phd/YefM family antitoxin [Pseudoxanthomonas composti]
MGNTITIAEIKRRGMAAIEEGLRQGPVRIIKRNKSAAVVLSEEEYLRLTDGPPPARQGLTALEWLLSQPASGTRSKAEIDAALAKARGW